MNSQADRKQKVYKRGKRDRSRTTCAIFYKFEEVCL